MRTTDKDNFDSTHRFRNDEFKIGDIILIFDFTTIINISASKKLNYRWIKLYRITKSDPLKGTYKVSELDSVILRSTYADNKLKRFHAAIVLDVFNRHETSAPSNSENNIVNFADAFQGEDLCVKNLVFEKENRNDEVKNENKAIKNEKQTELRAIISNNLPFTIVIPRRQGSKKANNNTRRYNLKG